MQLSSKNDVRNGKKWRKRPLYNDNEKKRRRSEERSVTPPLRVSHSRLPRLPGEIQHRKALLHHGQKVLPRQGTSLVHSVLHELNSIKHNLSKEPRLLPLQRPRKRGRGGAHPRRRHPNGDPGLSMNAREEKNHPTPLLLRRIRMASKLLRRRTCGDHPECVEDLIIHDFCGIREPLYTMLVPITPIIYTVPLNSPVFNKLW